jgi:hypothetical protein
MILLLNVVRWTKVNAGLLTSRKRNTRLDEHQDEQKIVTGRRYFKRTLLEAQQVSPTAAEKL